MPKRKYVTTAEVIKMYRAEINSLTIKDMTPDRFNGNELWESESVEDAVKGAWADILEGIANVFNESIRKEQDEAYRMSEAAAVYWAANDTHSGQASDAYKALSIISKVYEPGPQETGIDENDEYARLSYEGFCKDESLLLKVAKTFQ